ncbi:hypothetical protein [Hugenholtzia roseola]|uniref:hypothetical protein n=1 Tax=Hugenholtzia roseola TaxID=1002 RepID=UPI00047C4134|nr:hypothetical protein [Hugenholtzia roseola]
MSHKFHKFYLLITAFVIASFAPVFFLGTMLNTSEPARWTLDLLAFPLDGSQDYQAPTTRFLSALTGGFLLGWGITILGLRHWVYDLAPEGVRKSVVLGTVAWFCLDSAGSIAAGHLSNAFFNVLVLLVAIAPFYKPAKN